jgi:hypothetical protein
VASLPPVFTEPEFIELVDYWRRKSPPGRLPGRQHVDPMELSPRLLPHVLLMDVVRGESGPRFKFRLVGTGFVQLVGREVTGLFYDQIASTKRAAPLLAGLKKLVETGEPVYLEGPLTVPSRDFIWVKRVGLPLAEDGKTVDMVLAAVCSTPRPADRSGGAKGED